MLDEDAFIDGVDFVLQEEIRNNAIGQVHMRTRIQWPDAVRDKLLDALGKDSISDAAWQSCLGWGLACFTEYFLEYTSEWIVRASCNNANVSHQRIASVCTLYLQYCKEDPWGLLKKLLEADPKTLKAVLDGFSYGQPEKLVFDKMSDRSIAEFYVAITQVYPYGADTEVQSGLIVGNGVSIRMFRDQMFYAVLNRGNIETYKYIVSSLPGQKWINLHKSTVREAALRRTWSASTPEALLNLERRFSIPWHQTQAAFIGANIVSVLISLAGNLLYSNVGSIWLHAIVTGITGIVILSGSLWWLRSLRNDISNNIVP